MERDRLMIFADSRIGFSTRLLDAFLAELERRTDIELVGVCDAGPPSSRLRAAVARHLRRAARRLFNPTPLDRTAGRSSTLRGVARRHRARVVAPPGGDVNSPAFLARLDRERPTLGLSVGCLRIFREPLLAKLGYAVNFHDGALPEYRGLGATGWSLYRREAESGFSYHRMTPGIDEGPVLVSGRVPVGPDTSLAAAFDAKISAAAGAAGAVLDLMRCRDPGRPQAPGGRYYSRRAGARVRRIGEPSEIASDELLHRLRSFGLLELRLGGQWYEATDLRPANGRRGLTFDAADGVRLAVHRCLFLPVGLYRLYRPLRKRRRRAA